MKKIIGIIAVDLLLGTCIGFPQQIVRFNYGLFDLTSSQRSYRPTTTTGSLLSMAWSPPEGEMQYASGENQEEQLNLEGSNIYNKSQPEKKSSSLSDQNRPQKLKAKLQTYDGHDERDESTQNQRPQLDLESTPESELISESESEPMQTISGGPALIFAMARRMLVWDDESYQGLNDASPQSSTPSSSLSSSSTSSFPSKRSKRKTVLPRWHPIDGIADNNPSFRNQSPLMNNRGYAALIRRNSRKRGKVSLWRHALRMYEKMRVLEEKAFTKETGMNITLNTVGTSSVVDGDGATSLSSLKTSNKLVIMRGIEHHEAALVACAKLGLWREAIRIYREIEEEHDAVTITESSLTDDISTSTITNNQDNEGNTNFSSLSPTATVSITNISVLTKWRAKKRKNPLKVTDNMVLSVLSACVRGSKSLRKGEFSIEDRRVPLDAARDILLAMEKKHGLWIVSTHVNPLAAAYQHLGLISESKAIIGTTLSDRKFPALDDEVEDSSSSFNLNDIRAKDKASYNILVQGALTEGDWASAIDSLKEMTEAGLYPNTRNLNSWTEMAEKRERRSGGRKAKSWKKTRERMLVRGTLNSSN